MRSLVEEMVLVFEGTITFVEQTVADLPEAEMVKQPPGVPNHATWTLGHIIHGCQAMVMELGGAAWLPEDWESKFGYGSIPQPDPQEYLPKVQMVALLDDAKERMSKTLREADASVLGRGLPDETFPTMGDLLMQVVVAHTAYHAGQLAVWRRAVGRESAAVFV